MLTNIPGALSGAALLALLSTARRKNSRFFHQRPHQIILLGLTSFGGLQRARVAAKRYHLDLHKRVERKRVENFVEFTRIVDIEDADVRVPARGPIISLTTVSPSGPYSGASVLYRGVLAAKLRPNLNK
jgi:hypothetical protein